MRSYVEGDEEADWAVGSEEEGGGWIWESSVAGEASLEEDVDVRGSGFDVVDEMCARYESASVSDMKVSENTTSYCSISGQSRYRYSYMDSCRAYLWIG